MKRKFAYLCVALTLLGNLAYAKNENLLDRDYRSEAVKTEIVYRLLQYISWKSQNNEILTVCVEGNDKVNERMSDLTRRMANRSSIKIVLNPEKEEMMGCQVLYVSSDKFKKLALYKTILDKHAVLTISDLPHFIDVGGMVGLVEVQGRITVEVNIQVMNDHDIEPSPPLIEIANRVIN